MGLSAAVKLALEQLSNAGTWGVCLDVCVCVCVCVRERDGDGKKDRASVCACEGDGESALCVCAHVSMRACPTLCVSSRRQSGKENKA